MTLSKDYSLEVALKASLSDHANLSMGFRNELLGQFYLTLNEINCDMIDTKYLETVQFHEIIHYLHSISTSFKRLLLFLELEANKEDNIKELKIIRIQGRDYVIGLFSPINEAFAYFFQMMNPSIPRDLKEALMYELEHGDKRFIGSLLLTFAEIIGKFESKFHISEIPTEIRFTLSYNISRVILSVPIGNFFTPYFDPYHRITILSEIEEKQIPKWKDYNDIVNLVITNLQKNHLNFYRGDVFYSNIIDRTLENLAFWSWCIHALQNTTYEMIDPYLFGILSEIDMSFWPIYKTKSPMKKRLTRCLIREQSPDTFMGHKFIKDFKNIDKVLENKNYSSSQIEDIASTSSVFVNVLQQIIKYREDAFNICPKRCDLKNCIIKKIILDNIKEIKPVKYFAWPL